VLESATFDSGITGLTTDTPYYYACYATNGGGEDWSGSTMVFTTKVAWAYRMPVSFPQYTQAETLTNFPVLVQLSTGISGFDYTNFLSVAGYDLRFWTSDESVHLNHEIESWDTNGTSYVWVQVPELQSGTQILATWGSAADAGQPRMALS